MKRGETLSPDPPLGTFNNRCVNYNYICVITRHFLMGEGKHLVSKEAFSKGFFVLNS